MRAIGRIRRETAALVAIALGLTAGCAPLTTLPDPPGASSGLATNGSPGSLRGLAVPGEPAPSASPPASAALRDALADGGQPGAPRSPEAAASPAPIRAHAADGEDP